MTSVASSDWRTRISAWLGPQITDLPITLQMLALGLTWLTVALGAVALSAPATADALTLGLIVLLPIAGLVAMKPALILLLCVWLIAGASALIAATQATDLGGAVIHSSISIYLSFAFFVLAAFVAKRPDAHARNLMQVYVCAAVLASLAVLFGYVELNPGTDHQTTYFDHATGWLANSSAFGSFLVLPLLYVLHLMISRPLTNAVVPASIFALLGSAVLISSWPDAKANLIVGGIAYAFLAFTTSPTQLQRLKLILIAALGSVVLAGVLVVSAQQPQTSEVLAERAKAMQTNQANDAERWGGYSKAAKTIPLKPLGIGALEFGQHDHNVQLNNVYLSTMLQSGLISGLIFMAITLLTVAAGFAHAIKPGHLQPIIIITYSAFLGLIVQGLASDLEHWRHYYLTMAVLWGLIASNGPSSAFDEQAVDADQAVSADDDIHFRQDRIPTIIGPGRQTIATKEPEERRDRSHHPRRPQSMAYT